MSATEPSPTVSHKGPALGVALSMDPRWGEWRSDEEGARPVEVQERLSDLNRGAAVVDDNTGISRLST